MTLLTTLAVVGGATSQIKLGTRVLLPVLRSPVVLARELGTLASLVGRGRMLLGVGAGWMFEEFEAVGSSLESGSPDWKKPCPSCEPHGRTAFPVSTVSTTVIRRQASIRFHPIEYRS